MATGKQKEDFPGAFIPFDKSVGPVPTVSIDSAPTISLCINADWFPFVVACLKALARPETWNDTYDHSVIAASEFSALIAESRDGCGIFVPTKLCLSGSFADDAYLFIPTPGAVCDATWVSGTGWVSCMGSDSKGHLQIKREFATPTIIREIHLTIDVVVPYLINYDITLHYGSTFTSIASTTATTGPIIQIDVTGLSEIADALYIEIEDTFIGGGPDAQVVAFGMCYTGDFPLSIPATASFTHMFDFSISDGGWSAYAGIYSTYSGGAWNSVPVGSNSFTNAIQISCSSRNIRHVVIEFTASDVANGATRGICIDVPGTVPSGCNANMSPAAGSVVDDVALNVTASYFRINVDIATTPGAHTEISKITVFGDGSDPF